MRNTNGRKKVPTMRHSAFLKSSENSALKTSCAQSLVADLKEFKECLKLCLDSFCTYEKQTSAFKNSLETKVADSSTMVRMLKQAFEAYQQTKVATGLLLGFERVNNEWKMINKGGAYEL